MMNTTELAAERYAQTVMQWEGYTIVPHYVKAHHWVLPGGEVRNTVELLAAGAKPSAAQLWPRSWVAQLEQKEKQHGL